MTKSELILRMSRRFPQFTEQDVVIGVSSILESMAQALARGKRIEVRGFGSFDLRRRPSRQGRNPKTGQSVHVPAKYVPHFRTGRELRKRVGTVAASEHGESQDSGHRGGQRSVLPFQESVSG